MKSRTKPSVIIGVFLALILVAVAARYEEFVVTKLDVQGAANFDTTVVVTGVLTATGGVVGKVTSDQTTATATNAQDVTLSSTVTLVTSQGGANATTNTITLGRPTAAGFYSIVNSSDSTNLLAIAASGTWNSPALELGAGQGATLVAVEDADGAGTNAWYGLEL